ncbi:MAG TPA: HD domain-containing phosphohydrolase [Tepidisphaeraceae bacterium]|jgi:putative two-component system response regulator
MRILVVDDDPMSLAMLKHALKKAGYQVDTAGNGHEALQFLRSNPCSLIISDWMMPEMDGVQLCRAVRESDASGYVYFILLTSRDRSDDIIEGLTAGADEFMTKPFNPAELTVRVRTGERILSLETRDLTIFALAKLAESRDPETGAHLERVQNYSRALAQNLAMRPGFGEVDANFIRLIYLTSPLHDIGKVAIPDSVLLKPGKLTEEEFAIMKTHTTLGAQTLDAALSAHPEAKFLKMAREIAATHHEKFDGTGYPCGLSGADIPVCGRIVTLADVFDALCSKRVYKGAFSHESARKIIVEGTGKHFDPEVVQAFLRIEKEFIAIHEKFLEEARAAA